MQRIKKYVILFFLLSTASYLSADIPYPVKRLLQQPFMKGATFSFAIQDVDSRETLYAYLPDQEMIPASVMKTVTTATALELLGAEYRFETQLQYDGMIEGNTLKGNLYIKGGGDPTLGSQYLREKQTAFLGQWLQALQRAGIRHIAGSVIGDEGCYDTEGISLKWLAEDMGNYYGAGAYGLSVCDNMYQLQLKTKEAGSIPQIISTQPHMKQLVFHNHTVSAAVQADSAFIVGFPYATERYLYGILPANRPSVILKGDIPEPALFLADYLTDYLQTNGITVEKKAASRRQLVAHGQWKEYPRITLTTTYSPPLGQIVRITNEVSHNLYADLLLKAIGLQHTPSGKEYLSSFGKGISRLRLYWKEQGTDISPLWMFDGSGLAMTDKLSARFILDVLIHMQTAGKEQDAFFASLPLAGREGSVQHFLKGTALEGKARLKSGSMSRVKGYAGYLDVAQKRYAIAIFANNYSCNGYKITRAFEDLLVALMQPQSCLRPGQ